ncbi:hypothetical protein CT0861_01877 [Colletotrichum tofieldiae]|uniref:Uncharacterized protein n=1 Tax=Colletotrichum tofieldiae TaxID=708197 RepID=A0A166SBF3_9PEZI|nr:hypothetical protein CT0861_01877 [Colletotrichum tofieldiae]
MLLYSRDTSKSFQACMISFFIRGFRNRSAVQNSSKASNNDKMAQTEANTRQSAWMFSIDILAFLLLISLNGLPYFVSMWADQIVGKQTSSVVFKPILLQCIDDLQESLVLFLQPLFDNFAFDVLCNEEDIKDRRLITKADAFTTVVRVCAIKLPSVAVTLLMILPKTTLSASVCILTAVAWSSVIPRSAKTVQDEKKERDNSLSEKKPEAEEHQRKYLQSLSSLSMRLFSWKMLRHGCLFLFALCSPGLDPTLMTRFVHQVAALEAVMLKWVQSYHRAGDIIQVLSKNKLPDQSTVAAVIQGLRAGSDRSCVWLTRRFPAANICCIGKLHDRARKCFKGGPLLPVAHGYCDYTGKLPWSYLTKRKEYRPLLDTNTTRDA